MRSRCTRLLKRLVDIDKDAFELGDYLDKIGDLTMDAWVLLQDMQEPNK